MRAYRMIHWGGNPRAVEVPAPEPAPGQVLVRVAGCGLCHSDFAMRAMPQAMGAKLGWAMPFTLGHEIGGWIASGGTDGGTDGGTVGLPDGFAVGDPVALVSANSCGRCALCERGSDNCCTYGAFGRGYGRDGGLAEYVLVDDARALLRLLKVDPFTAGPLTDAGATAYHAVRRALPRLGGTGGTAVVIGAGGLGAFAVQFLRLLSGGDTGGGDTGGGNTLGGDISGGDISGGARIVAVDSRPQALERAEELGVHEGLSGADKLRHGSADVVLDFVGTDETISAGVAAVRPGGAFGLVGAAGGRLDRAWFTGLPRDGEVFTFQGGTIADAREVIALAEDGLIRNDVTVFPFDRIDEAYARLASGTLTGRAVITPAS